MIFFKLTKHDYSKCRPRANWLKVKLRMYISQVVGSRLAVADLTIVITYQTDWLVIMSGIKKNFVFLFTSVLCAESIVQSIARDFDMCVCGEKMGDYRKTLALWNALYTVCVRDVLCAAIIKYEINLRPYPLLLHGERPNVFFFAWGARVELFFLYTSCPRSRF